MKICVHKPQADKSPLQQSLVSERSIPQHSYVTLH